MENQLDIFFKIFLQAIENVDKEYFETAHHNIPFQEDVKRLTRNRFMRVDDDILYKPGERIFSYELYYQTRKLLVDERKKDESFLKGCALQAEVKKHQLYPILEKFKLEPLSGNFVPDLIFHTPGDDSIHAFVIEIKATYKLSPNALLQDLSKLNEFILNYRYERGIFLAIYISSDYIKNLIEEEHLKPRLHEIISFETAKRIQVVTREWVNAPVENIILSELIY
jgi:hypothetical protein